MPPKTLPTALLLAALAPAVPADIIACGPSVPPGVYFRMLIVGYIEGITSQRGIAWRCID